jgi:hypothetical protein
LLSLSHLDAAVPFLLGALLVSHANGVQGQRSWVAEAFPAGERMLFEGRYGFISLGDATMTVLPDEIVRGAVSRALQLTISANLIGVYRINDRFVSWVDCTTGFSSRFTQEYDESNQQHSNVYEIFPDSGFFRQTGIDSLMPTVVEPLDETAFLYWVRTLDLEPGDTLRLERYFRPDRNPITVAVLTRDTIDVPAGRFPTLVVQPTIPDGGLLFSEKAEARVWLSDDDRRLVVQIKVKLLSFATVALRLKEFEIPEQPPSCHQ